jgi:DNA primase catalytic core
VTALHVHNLRDAEKALDAHLKDYLLEKGIGVTRGAFLCPFHDEINPSAKFLPDSSGRAHCFGCNKSFGILAVYAHLEKAAPPYKPGWIQETLLPLATKYGVPLSLSEPTSVDRHVSAMAALNEEIATYISQARWNANVLAFIKQRGWTEDICRELKIGAIDSISSFTSFVTSRGYKQDILKDCEVDRQDLFNPDNLLYSIRDQSGRYVGFTARRTTWREGSPGEKCTQNSNNVLFAKKAYLGGGHHLARLLSKGETRKAVVLEGMGDWVSAWQAGVRNCIAIGGSVISSEQADALKKLGLSELVLCLDNDTAGQAGMSRFIEDNKALAACLNLSVCLLPEGVKDPGAFFLDHSAEDFEKLPRYSFVHWRILREKQQGLSLDKIADSALRLLVAIPDPIIVYGHIKEISPLLDLPISLLQDKLDQIKHDIGNERQETEKRLVSSSLDRFKRYLEGKDAVQANPRDIADDLIAKLDGVSGPLVEKKFGPGEFLAAVASQEKTEEEKGGAFDGLVLPSKGVLQNILYANSKYDATILLGGKQNAGKTGFLASLAIDILEGNDGVRLDPYGSPTSPAVVVYHATDDPRAKILNRVITSLAARQFPLATMNRISNPGLYRDKFPELGPARAAAYAQVRKWVGEGRLLIKDVTHGKDVHFVAALMRNLRKQFPFPKYVIVYIIDNLSKASDASSGDQADIKAMCERAKDLALVNHVVLLSTVQYTKLRNGVRPTDFDFFGSVQFGYDADLTMHMLNHLAEDPETPICWQSEPDKFTPARSGGGLIRWPVSELIIKKNKLTEFTNVSLWYRMVPPQAGFVEVTDKTQAQVFYQQAMEAARKTQRMS